MKVIKVKIVDPIGLHARPASKFSAEASKYKSNIQVMLNGRTGNAKSVINLMALGVRCGSEIEIQATGIDEKEAIDGIKQLLVDNKLI